MSIQDFGNTIRNAKVVSLSQGQQTIQNSIGGNDSLDVIEVRLNGRSTLNAELSYGGMRPLMTLFHDKNRDGKIKDREKIAIASAPRSGVSTLSANNLKSHDNFYITVEPGSAPGVTGSSESHYFLSLNAPNASAPNTGVSNSSRITSLRQWQASFLNLDGNNLTDYSRYNFSRPDAVYNLGEQGKHRRTIAKLNIDYGLKSPAGIQTDNFAMEAWTRIRLRSGKFYRLSSSSDDGMRFIFRDRKTGKVLTEFNDNWIDRSTNSDEWSQIFTPSKSARYDFYVQYYEKKEAAVVDVTLEKAKPIGKVTSSTLNLRRAPSAVGNAPIGRLVSGETFKIRRLVQSSTDEVYKDWYRVVTNNKQKGYIAAGSDFVSIVGETAAAVTLGDGETKSPTMPDNVLKPIKPGLGDKGVISSSVWITSDDKISIRSDKNTSGIELGRVGQGTSLDVIEKVTGGRYLNGFDAWYRVRLNLNGQTQEGFVAAYYVDVVNDGGLYSTGISKENRLYKPHLDEVLDPTYYWTSYKPYIEQAASRYSWLNASVVAGIGSRESAWGRILSPPGPGGTGDGGHGRGLMQIDDRFHQPFINSGRWSNPKDNIDYGINEVLSKNYAYLDANTSLQGTDLLRGAIASYNAGLGSVTNALREGRDVDYYTTGKDYSWDVLNRAGWFQLHGWQ